VSDDRDFRPEALDVGDEIRWQGRWCRIMGMTSTTQSFVLRLLDGNRWLTVFYWPGCWVAARPKQRDEAPA
jgi:hypothetical protein